jgi:pimeloyl-ACP methyl ester carboxylesterase
MAEFTTRDGTQVFFKDWGSGQPIVFSHGWPLSSGDWDAQMLFFLHHGYRVIAHDRRGHGRSGQVSEGNDMDATPATWPAWSSTSTCMTPSTSGIPRAAARWHATSAATASPGWRRWCWSAP